MARARPIGDGETLLAKTTDGCRVGVMPCFDEKHDVKTEVALELEHVVNFVVERSDVKKPKTELAKGRGPTMARGTRARHRCEDRGRKSGAPPWRSSIRASYPNGYRPGMLLRGGLLLRVTFCDFIRLPPPDAEKPAQ